MKILKVCIITVIILATYTNIIKSYTYYDLFFEKSSEIIVKEEYKNINIKDSIKIKYDQNLSKDEIDIINYNIKNYLDINKMLNSNVLENENQEEVIITYININGRLIKDYKTWSKSKNVNIMVPINIE